MHPRRAIRNAIKTHLLAGNTDAEERVFMTMSPPIGLEDVLVDEGAVIVAYVTSETIKPEDYAAQGLEAVRCTLEFELEGLVAAQAGVDIDEKIDALAEQVEALFETWTPDGFPAAEIRLMETQIGTTRLQEITAGSVFMTWQILYWKPWRRSDDAGWVGGDGDYEPRSVSAVIQNTPPPELLISED